MAELERNNLWAPWRIGYVQGLDDGQASSGTDRQGGGCFLCRINSDTSNDRDNLVLWRTPHSIVVLNRYPYNNGHTLVAPVRHIAELAQADDEELLELTKLVRDTQKALTCAISPHGFNVGMNFGRCAGAGLPDHLHIHIVPRWNGDTNFMSVCADTKVISQSLAELLEQLRQVSREHNLPAL